VTGRPAARRLLGAVLVLAVVLGVPIAGRRDGQRVVGTAVLARTVVVPAVGDCLAALTGPTPTLVPMVVEPSAAVVDGSSAMFAGCGGTHLGEVAALRRDPPGPDQATRTSGAARWCTDVGVTYREHLRWQAAAAGGEWTPAVVQRFLAVVSGPGADGWAVCVVLAPGLEPYRGSYLGSLADTAAPAPFGSCRSGDLPEQQVSCQLPHREQLLGTAPSGVTPTDAGCRALAARLTAMSDPTGSGRLAVGVVGTGAAATCRVRVAGPERLTATLLGLGDAPLPLTTG